MSIRIGVGPGLYQQLSNDDYWRWVALCETSDIDSIWHSDQLLGPGHEPLVMLAALAARTRKLRFGTNAVVASHRDPLILAKQLVTIDFLGSGRLFPVFGVGNANDPVWGATGRDAKERGKKANEVISLVRRLLTEESVSFQGEYFQYQDVRITPRPGRPIPIWIGGESEAAIQRTAALGDGWLGGFTTPANADQVIKRIKAALLETERSIDPDHYGVIVPFRIGPADHPSVISFQKLLNDRANSGAPFVASGDSAAVIAAFRRYADAGVSKFIAIPVVGNPEDLMTQTQKLAANILPVLEDR